MVAGVTSIHKIDFEISELQDICLSIPDDRELAQFVRSVTNYLTKLRKAVIIADRETGYTFPSIPMKREWSEDLQMHIINTCQRINNSQEKFDKHCTTQAENARKGNKRKG